MPEYMSFEDVLGQLKLSEDQLKGLVSEGELRAFRDEDKMKFRKEDVEALRQNLQQRGEPGVVLPSEGAPAQEGTILDIDSVGDQGILEQAPPLDTSVPSLDFGEGAPPVEQGEEMTLPESGELPAPEGTGVPEEDFGGQEGTILEPAEGEGTSVTQEMPVAESSDLVVHPSDEESSTGEESGETFVEDSSQLAGTQDVGAAEGEESAAVEEEAPAEEVEAEAAPARRGARAPVDAAAAAPRAPSPVMTVFLFLCAVAMALVGYVFVDLIRTTVTPDPVKPCSFAQTLLDKLAGKQNKVR